MMGLAACRPYLQRLFNCVLCARHEALSQLGYYWLCDRCRDDFNDLALRSSSPIHSLFQYKDAFRRLLLNGKIKGDQQASSVLAALALRHPTCSDLLAWADVIMPAPASFWSRVRGRLDVAGAVAEELAKAAGLVCLPAPAHLHWRFKKRARMAVAQRALSEGELSAYWTRLALRHWVRRYAQGGKNGRILIFDDVVTTGFTLRRVAASLQAAEIREVQLLALGEARVHSPLSLGGGLW